MKLGEKIRLARLNAGMTQNELAGDFITRNMLSQIENGLAMPSLQTALYIADKLGIDAGLLFSDENNMDVYYMTRKLPELKRLYAEGELDKCFEMVDEKNTSNDEAMLILAECHIKKACRLYKQGRLKNALKECEIAKGIASKTVYSAEGIVIRAEMLEEMIAKAVPSLRQTKRTAEERAYLRARFEKNSEFKYYYSILRDAKELVGKNEYKQASEMLREILKRERELDLPLIYFACGEYEICCRELDDYESAYKCAQKAKMLLEQMQA